MPGHLAAVHGVTGLPTSRLGQLLAERRAVARPLDDLEERLERLVESARSMSAYFPEIIATFEEVFGPPPSQPEVYPGVRMKSFVPEARHGARVLTASATPTPVRVPTPPAPTEGPATSRRLLQVPVTPIEAPARRLLKLDVDPVGGGIP